MEKQYTRRQFMKLGIAGSCGAILTSYPVMIERYLLEINTYTIPVHNLPNAFNGFTILQLTDLHFGFLMPEWFIEHILTLANQLPKDITICTGDYVQKSGSKKNIETIWAYLNRLEAPQGVYSILGNHDYSLDAQKSIQYLEASGQSLLNKATTFERGGSRIWMAGCGDIWRDRINFDSCFQNIPADECKIALAHNPDTADIPYKTSIDLMIAGHTHGGQVRLPFLGAPILPVRNKRYSSGLIETPRMNLYISRGIGWAIYPIRFNCPPEISILKLVPSTL